MAGAKMSEVVFFGIMTLASVFTLVRGFSVAAVIPVEDFAHYAVAIAVGSFLSIVISAGRVELSMKAFPRLWIAGRGREIAKRADATTRTMFLRSAALLGVCGGVAIMAGQSVRLSEIGGAVVFGFLAGTISNYASALRASGDLSGLALCNFARAIGALAFAVLGAVVLGWIGALIGEVVGALIAAVLTRTIAVVRGRAAPQQEIFDGLDVGDTSGGSSWLFASALLNAAVIFLDRPFVAAHYGAVMAGEFAFLMMFSMGASTVVGILVQSTGPRIIHLAAGSASITAQLNYIARRILAVSALFVIGMSCAAVALLVAPLTELGAHYSIALERLYPVAVLCILHCVVFFDWALMAKDRENAVLIASIGNAAVFAVAIVLTIWLNLTIVMFLWCLVAARILQMVMQLSAILDAHKWLSRS